jgi:hypothetical protein
MESAGGLDVGGIVVGGGGGLVESDCDGGFEGEDGVDGSDEGEGTLEAASPGYLREQGGAPLPWPEHR